MQEYESNCTSRTDWFDLFGISCYVFEPEQLNAFECLEALLTATFMEEPLVAYFWEQLDIPSTWNTHCTNAAREGAGMDIHNPMFEQHWTKYRRLHIGQFTDCDPKEACDCERHNCVGAQSMGGHTAAAAITAISLGILQIVEIPSTLTPSETDAYNWHW